MPDMPNEGANTFPIAVGDFNKGYRIVDRVMVSVLRDPFTLSSLARFSIALASALAVRSCCRKPSSS
jgi:HK97 family phage major capsid protein